jgi:hypothetical protein
MNVSFDFSANTYTSRSGCGLYATAQMMRGGVTSRSPETVGRVVAHGACEAGGKGR